MLISKSMKHYKSILAVLALASFGVCSCNDLDLNESQYHTKKYQFSDFAQVKEVMTNVYGYLESGFYNFQECASDDAVYANQPDTCRRYYNGSWSANNTVDDKWSHYYSGIRAANYLIENCPEDFEIARWDESYKYNLEQLKNYPWEAKALRAFFHMELLKRYGSIVIADRTFTRDEVNELVPATYDAAVKWISSELKECAEHLPKSYSDSYFSELGRVTQGFALAARSRLLLYAASPLHNESAASAKYAEAASAALDFINANATGGKFTLSKQSFNVESKEMIFGIRETASNTYEINNFPAGYENALSGTCPSLNLVEAFDMADGTPFDFDTHKDALTNSSSRDPRFARAILSTGDSFKGETIESFTGGRNGAPLDNATPTGFYLRKFVQESTSLSTGNITSYQHIYPIFRVSEVYLNYAEALFEGTKNPDFKGTLSGVNYTLSPREALNAVRAVYGMAEIPAGLGEDGFRTRLRNERRVELCFEGHRFWDLRRWKLGEESAKVYGVKLTRAEDGSFGIEKTLVQNRFWDEKMYLYPISAEEIHKNPYLNQNQGW